MTTEPTWPDETLDPWATITPEDYNEHPIIGGWPWCEGPGQFPIDYTWLAPCSPVDPCLPGGRTLWNVTVCTPAEAVTTAAIDPLTVTLPETGLSTDITVLGTIAIALGVIAVRLSRRPT